MKRLLTFILVLHGLMGCVMAQRQEVMTARSELERCQAEHPKADPECTHLVERLKAAQRNYETRARQAWGCDPAQEECPTPR